MVVMYDISKYHGFKIKISRMFIMNKRVDKELIDNVFEEMFDLKHEKIKFKVRNEFISDFRIDLVSEIKWGLKNEMEKQYLYEG